MKKTNYMDLLGYKLKLFITKEFCVLSFLVIVCVVILLLFTFNIRICVDLDNNICNNINSVLVSITSGYLVSYLVYLLTVRIPDYTQAIVNDRIICNRLSSYKDRLLYSFGGLTYILKKEGKIIEIPGITKLFESHEPKDEFIVKIIQLTYDLESKITNNLLLAKEFERLEDAFQNLLNMNAMYKGQFSHDIYQLQTSSWIDIILIIKEELKSSLDGFDILNDSKTIILINQNFDLANKAIEINNLYNN